MSSPDDIATDATQADDIWEWGANHCVRASPTAQLYRYVRVAEAQDIRTQGLVDRRGQTWLTPDTYDDPVEAQRMLALANRPDYRIGPIWSLDVAFDGAPLQLVPPRFGQPGGGWQLSTTRRIPYGERRRLA